MSPYARLAVDALVARERAVQAEEMRGERLELRGDRSRLARLAWAENVLTRCAPR